MMKDEFIENERRKNTERLKKYRATPSGKEAIKKSTKKYAQEHPDRVKIYSRIKHIKKKPCEVCGAEKVHKHHSDYSKPFDVSFLCPLHHRQAHGIFGKYIQKTRRSYQKRSEFYNHYKRNWKLKTRKLALPAPIKYIESDWYKKYSEQMSSW